jgi:hypothetical protein
MAVKPKVARKSPAQVAAGQAFAAAGRAAQSATRAAAIKKTGKPPPVSKARKAATQKWAAAGRAAQAAARVKKAGGRAVTPKAKAALAPSELLALPGLAWPAGCNDVAPTCAAVAVACHLQAATGLVMPDKEILRLHEKAGGAAGASIADVLEVLRDDWGPVTRANSVRLLSFFRTDEECLVAGLVVGVQLPHAGHAVLSAPGGMISWGRYMAWEGDPDEAWACEWGVR